MEKLKIEYININKIKPNEYNPKKMTEKEAKDLEKSIIDFGIVDPLIINRAKERKGIIIGGHQRYNIYQKLGYKEVPIVWVNIPDMERERKLCLRLSKNIGSWDYDELANFDENMLLDVGFDNNEIDKMFDIKKDEDINEEDAPIKEENLIKVKEGDIYQLGKHRIMCADCTDNKNIKKLIGNEIIDLCLTDPPYNLRYEYNIYKDNKTPEEYKKWCELWFENIKEISEQILITPGLQNLFMWFGIEKPRWVLCWLKRNAQSGCTLRGFNRHEPIILYGKYEPIIFWGNIKKIIPEDYYDFEIDKKEDIYDVKTAYFEDYEKDKPHSCPKPIRLFARLIKDFTSSGHVILDIFLGSGTSIIASERMHRICYGMDIDPHYISIAIKRWENYTNKKAVKLNEQ